MAMMGMMWSMVTRKTMISTAVIGMTFMTVIKRMKWTTTVAVATAM
jgi:hypothetical protein